MLAACTASEKNYSVIEVPVPERPAGQTDMVAFAADPIDTVKVGIIGLGMRGPGAVERMLNIDGARVVALCDIEPARCDSAQAMILRAGAAPADIYTGSDSAWRELVARPDLDLVYVVTDWEKHAMMGVAAMEAGMTQFDGSFGGLGGCPFVPNAAGNISTEDVINMCDEMGVETGVDIVKVMELSRTMRDLLGHDLDSYILRAGRAKDLIVD